MRSVPSSGVPIGPGGIPLARRGHPVTLPIYSDNEPIDSGKDIEKGPLQVFNWADYINPQVVKQFQKEFGVQVKITTFENEEEAIAKLTSGQGNFDVWFPTVDYISRAVAGKLIQPLNHSYVPNLKNVWPSLQSPFYDRHSRYTVPYTIYTTGIAWRTDKVKKGPTELREPLRHLLALAGLQRQGRDPRRPAGSPGHGHVAPPRVRREHRERHARSTGRRATSRS